MLSKATSPVDQTIDPVAIQSLFAAGFVQDLEAAHGWQALVEFAHLRN
jgi:hypothetical protein